MMSRWDVSKAEALRENGAQDAMHGIRMRTHLNERWADVKCEHDTQKCNVRATCEHLSYASQNAQRRNRGEREAQE